MKTLKELFEIYRPKAKGEQDFVDKHVVIKHKDRNGNGDDLFKGKTKVVDRKKERHGYDVGEDEKVYEEAEELDEAVSVSHDRYLRSHGKKASGSGAWIFTHKKYGNIDLNDDKSSHIGKGKFSDAAKSAKAWAKKHGHTTIYVAEEHADEMLRNAILEMADLEGEDLTEENLDTLVETLLDELSKDTLKSYMKKSIHSSAAAWRDADGNVLNFLPKDAKKTISKRYKGQNSAERKLAKEEVELDEVSKNFLKNKYIAKSRDDLSGAQSHNYRYSDITGNPDASDPDQDAKDYRRAEKREKGISLARAKINKSGKSGSTVAKVRATEEVEQTNEAVKNPYAVGMAAAMKSTGDTPLLKKSTIRKGHEISKKLTKEDVINRAIEKYVVSEAELPTPADRLLSKLDGLSETHVNTLLTIFDSLNEDNQMKMLYTAETQEGILSLLDFAIQNKGA